LAGLAAVSIVSAVGLGGNPSKAQQPKDAERTLFALPLNPQEEIPQYVQSPPPVEFPMRMRQITNRMFIGAKDPKSCASAATSEAKTQLKDRMWSPALGDLFLVCVTKDKKTKLLNQKSIICEPSKDGPVCNDPDQLTI
jgi:hypothetical protein